MLTCFYYYLLFRLQNPLMIMMMVVVIICKVFNITSNIPKPLVLSSTVRVSE